MTSPEPTSRLNKAELADAVAAELGVSRKDGTRALNAVLNVITRTVIAGHEVNVTNFGTWRVVDADERTARNPQTGQRIVVPPRRRLSFRVSPRLRALMTAGDPTASIRKRPSRRRP